MSFAKRIWLPHDVQYPGRKVLLPTGNPNEYDFVRSEGLVNTAGDLLSAENLNELESRIVTAFTPELWIAPTLLNGWVNFGGAYSTAGYFKDSFGLVHLRGFVKSGTATGGTDLLILPSGYIPSSGLYIPSRCQDSSSEQTIEILVSSSGHVQMQTAATLSTVAWLTLDNIHFRAA